MKHFKRILIPTVVLMLSSAVTGKEAVEDHNYYYIFNHKISRADVDIELNGVPLAKSEKAYEYSATGFSDIGMWVHPGPNKVTVNIRSMVKDENSARQPMVEFSISIAKKGQMSDEGKNILTFRLPESDKTDGKAAKNISFPMKKELTFTPEYAPPSELWSKATVAVLDAKAKSGIVTLVTAFHTALAKKDVDALYSLILFRDRDVSKLRYLAPDEPATLKQGIRDLYKSEGFAMAPLDQKKLVLRPVADGKVVWVTDALEGCPVSTKDMPDGGAITFALYVSLIDGKWEIVR